MWQYTHYDELMHYGVLGMKWGVRRARRDAVKLAKGVKKSIELQDELNKKAHDVVTVEGINIPSHKFYNVKQVKRYNKQVRKVNALMDKLDKKYGSDWSYSIERKKGKVYVEGAIGKISVESSD